MSLWYRRYDTVSLFPKKRKSWYKNAVKCLLLSSHTYTHAEKCNIKQQMVEKKKKHKT